MPLNSVTEQFCRQGRELHTPAELAAILAADVTTADNIQTDDLSGYLTTTPGLFGAFLAYKMGQLPAEAEPFRPALATLDYILTNLRGRVVNGQVVGGYIRTTDPAIAGQMAQMIGGFQRAEMVSDGEAAGFVALGGGGYAYGALDQRPTEGEVAALFAADDLDAARRELLNLCAVTGLGAVTALINRSDPIPDHAACVAAFQTALG